MPVDHIHQILQSLGRTLAHAIARSSEVSGIVRRIHREGYSLSLVLQDGKRSAQVELTAPRPPRDPAFRLGGKDVTFLKSLGIDATRSGKRRRGTSA